MQDDDIVDSQGASKSYFEYVRQHTAPTEAFVHRKCSDQTQKHKNNQRINTCDDCIVYVIGSNILQLSSLAQKLWPWR